MKEDLKGESLSESSTIKVVELEMISFPRVAVAPMLSRRRLLKREEVVPHCGDRVDEVNPCLLRPGGRPRKPAQTLIHRDPGPKRFETPGKG